MRITETSRFTKAELEYINASITFAKNHFFRPITVSGLANNFNVSVPKLQAGFKIKTGASVYEYIIRLRLEEAKCLLSESDEPIKCIALKTGFKSPSRFSELFKDRFGMTPQAFRTENLIDSNEVFSTIY